MLFAADNVEQNVILNKAMSVYTLGHIDKAPCSRMFPENKELLLSTTNSRILLK